MASVLEFYGYGAQYTVGDFLYSVAVFLAMCLLIAGLMTQCHREGANIHDQPLLLKILSSIGVFYAFLQPAGFFVFITLVFCLIEFGSNGQLIMAMSANVLAFCYFCRCLVPSKI